MPWAAATIAAASAAVWRLAAGLPTSSSFAAGADQLPDGAAAGTPLLFVALLAVTALASLAVWGLRKRPTSPTDEVPEPGESAEKVRKELPEDAE